MNRYLGISQVTTASHNPRSNAVVERFMQHLNGCLTKCDDAQYNNMKDYLSARAGSRLQIIAEGGMDLTEADKSWERESIEAC